MTTTASNHVSVPNEIWDNLLSSFAAKASPRAVSVSFQAVPAAGDAQGSAADPVAGIDDKSAQPSALAGDEPPRREEAPEAGGSGSTPLAVAQRPRGQHHRSHRYYPDIQWRSGGRVARGRN